MTTIFDPIKLGDLELSNRIIMAPLTRCRADAGRVPNALMAEYYVQRASAGLILSEATSVTPMGVGYPDTPGIWSNDQVRGWANVTKAVHGAGGKIFLQLWHVGRISYESYLDGETPVAPSAIQPKGHVSLIRPQVNYPTPRALEIAEIADIVDAYRVGAENAKAAGFEPSVTLGMPGTLNKGILEECPLIALECNLRGKAVRHVGLVDEGAHDASAAAGKRAKHSIMPSASGLTSTFLALV